MNSQILSTYELVTMELNQLIFYELYKLYYNPSSHRYFFYINALLLLPVAIAP